VNNTPLDNYRDIPEIISSPVVMTEANQVISIYEGNFVLKNKDLVTKMTGKISFEWYPSGGVTFKGQIQKGEKVSVKFDEDYDLMIKDLPLGKCFLTSFPLLNNIWIEGKVRAESNKGDTSILVTKVGFAIPNLREFHGEPVKKIKENGEIQKLRNRLIFDNDKYNIIIDKCSNFKELSESLKEKGGYIILYAGELSKKDNSINYKETSDILDCFSSFLSFLNGRRVSPLFRKGFYENEEKWCDFSNYFVDSYKNIITWVEDKSVTDLKEIWKKFYNIWNNDDGKSFLRMVVHWYTEANSSMGIIEGSIVLAQVALELIYNWYIIEDKKMLLGKDSENITASNKIRLLISQLNSDSGISSKLTNLKSYADKNKLADGPEVFVNIRNSIVHSQEEKRKKLHEMNIKIKYEALELGLWYIELSLLHILGYEGKYYNRCTRSDSQVPWSKQFK
jgi:hypothetical protein